MQQAQGNRGRRSLRAPGSSGCLLGLGLVLASCGQLPSSPAAKEGSAHTTPRSVGVTLELPALDRAQTPWARLWSLLGLVDDVPVEAKSYLPFHVGLRITSADGVVRFANTVPLSGEEFALALPYGPTRVQAVLLGEPLAEPLSKDAYCASKRSGFKGVFHALGEATVVVGDDTSTLPVSFSSLRYAEMAPFLVRAASTSDVDQKDVTLRAVDLLSGQPVLGVCDGKPHEVSTNERGIAAFSLPLGANAGTPVVGLVATGAGVSPAANKPFAVPEGAAALQAPLSAFLQLDTQSGVLSPLSPKRDPLGAGASLEALLARGADLRGLLALAREHGGSLANVWFATQPLPVPAASLTFSLDAGYACQPEAGASALKNLPGVEVAWLADGAPVAGLAKSPVSRADIDAVLGVSQATRALSCKVRYVFADAKGVRQEGVFSAPSAPLALAPTAVASPTPTASPTLAPSATPVISPSPFPTAVGTPSPTPGPSPSATPVVTPSPTPLPNVPPSDPTSVFLTGFTGNPSVNSTLSCNASGSIDPESGGVTYVYSWMRRMGSDPYLSIMGQSASSISGMVVGRGYEVYCTAYALDGSNAPSGVVASSPTIITNELPSVSGTLSQTSVEDDPVTFTLTAFDPEGDILSANCVSACPSGVVLSFNSGTGVATLNVGSPLVDVPGSTTFDVRFNDGFGFTTKTLTLTVNPFVPMASSLQFSPAPPGSVAAGANFSTTVSIRDQRGGVFASGSHTVSLSLHTNPDCTGTPALSVPFTASLAAVSGNASFSSLTVADDGNYYVKAFASGVGSTCSPQVSVTPPNYRFAVEGSQPPLTEIPMGLPFIYKFQLRNTGALSNTVSSVTTTLPGSVSLQLGDGQMTCDDPVAPDGVCMVVLQFLDNGAEGGRSGNVSIASSGAPVILPFNFEVKRPVEPLYGNMGSFFHWGNVSNPVAGLTGQSSVTPCDPNAGSFTSCAPFGAMRKFTMPSALLCATHYATDVLDAYEWSCEEVAGNTHFVGRLKPEKGLRDVIDAVANPPKHMLNRVIVSPNGSASVYHESALMPFYNDPLNVVVSSGAPVPLTSNTIHIARDPNLSVAGLSLSGSTALVTTPGASLMAAGSPSTCLTTVLIPVSGTDASNTTCLVKVAGAFNWVEASLSAANRHAAITLVGATNPIAAFNTVRGTKTRGGAHGLVIATASLSHARNNIVASSHFEGVSDYGILLKTTQFVRLSDIQISKAAVGLKIVGSSSVTSTRLTTSNTQLAGVVLASSGSNALMQTTVSGSASGLSIQTGSADNVVGGLTAAFLTGAALDISGTVSSTGISNLFVANASEAVRVSTAFNVCDATASPIPNVSLMNLAVVDVPLTHRRCHGGSTDVSYSGHVNTPTGAPVCQNSAASTCSSNPFASVTQYSSTGALFESFVSNFLSSDDTTNTEASGVALSMGTPDTSLTQWTGFEKQGRAWVRHVNGDPLSAASRKGPCASSSCIPFDFDLTSPELLFHSARVGGAQPNDNGQFLAPSGVCETSALRNTADDTLNIGAAYILRNAFEVLDDLKGDEDGRCEGSETCVYMPHVGAFQGSDGIRKEVCQVTSGTVTGTVLMKSYANMN